MKNMSIVASSMGPTPISHRKRPLGLVAIFAACTLALGGCDDDDDTLPGDAAADTRPADALTGDAADTAPAAGMCKGGFSSVNRAQLGAATTSGMCMAATDLDLICNNDVAAKTRTCGSSCLVTMGTANPTAFLACVSNCVALEHPLSAGCLGCYTGSVACTLANCLGPCSADPAAAACISCQTTNNCLSAFFTCSGLPSGAPAPDGGVADGGPDGGAADGGDTAPSVDAPPVDAAADMTAPADTGVDSATD